MTNKKPALDFNEAFKALDPKSMFPFLNADHFGDWFRLRGFDSLDPATMTKFYQNRLEALARANDEAKTVYRLQLERQFSIFDEIMSAAKESLKQIDVSGGTDAPKNILKVYSEASDKAIALMQRLSKETLAAVQEAQKRVADQVDAAIKDIRRT